MSARLLMVCLILGVWFASAGPAGAQYRYGRGGYGYGYGFGLGAWSPAAFMTGLGRYNQLSSQAAINYQQAYSMSLDNRLKYEQTYFQMRRENASERAAIEAQRPHLTPEQYVEINRARIPNRLSPSELDPGRGVFAWPQSLAGDEFAKDRARIEGLFAARDAVPQSAGLGSENYRQIKRSVTAMADHLHAVINEMSPDEYIAASKFLKSLEHEARFAPGTEVANR